MPESSRLSRFDHLKAIFSRNSSPEPETKDDSTSETTLVPRETKPRNHKKRDVLQDYNAADMCFGSCCRN
ncbi:hypothetical protein PENVUL_c071G00590 [Penicillium vulpinum]|uniref:Uncharacterized protein n=1 Tax=Penicillium vulpinum TaxID=29845 RepID=A0A1V6RBJ9_9EURO|nr:hypothetical protein PENVUL_c071G00590 [Penicillium vulpinum]